MTAHSWSDLLRDDPARLKVELAKAGVSSEDLVLAVHDVPELRETCRLLGRDFEALFRLALEWFGDKGQLEPEKRSRPDLLLWRDEGPRYGWPLRHFGRLPRLEDEERAPVEVEERQAGKARHRPPDPIPRETVKALKLELAKRQACRGNRKLVRERGLTQEEIAERLALTRTRVEQAEALERIGWDLLRSHPEFSAKDDFVRWPSPKGAAQILASERAEN
jgi:hypothetical protein